MPTLLFLDETIVTRYFLFVIGRDGRDRDNLRFLERKLSNDLY